MLCDKCNKREAKIYYTEIVNGIKKEQHLCEECASEATSFHLEGNNGRELSLGGLLSSILGNYYNNGKNGQKVVENITCGKCGMTYEEFLQTGKFGCSGCYKSFAPYLSRCFKNIQGADTHSGKKPKGYAVSAEQFIKGLSELEILSIKLQDAIEKEEFEKAAKYRDEIRELKKKEEEKEVHNA